MKLYPFSKKSSAYHDKVKEDYNKLDHELAGLKKQLESAKAAEDRERSIYEKLCENSHNQSEKKSRQHQAWSEASNLASNIASQISQMDSRISSLRRLVEAPGQYTTAKKKLEDLFARQTSLNGDLEKTDALLAKVGKRIADLETRNATETKAAAQSLLNNDGEFAVPESLTKLDLELRLSKASQAELQNKREALVVEQRELSNAIGEARWTYVILRDVITEIELHDQLMPIMGLFARAMVTRHERSNGNTDERRYQVDIPHELIEQAVAALAAEMPTA